MQLFRKLNPAEEREFRAWAEANDPDMSKWETYHPVCRDEWIQRGIYPPTYTLPEE
jgi:hypothetical protein